MISGLGGLQGVDSGPSHGAIAGEDYETVVGHVEPDLLAPGAGGPDENEPS